MPEESIPDESSLSRPTPPPKNWALVAGSVLMEFAASIWVQKHGANTPDWVVGVIFAIGAIPAFIAAARYERFLKAGGKLKEQIAKHPLSSALLCLMFLMVSCSTITTLVKRSNQQPGVSSKPSPDQKLQSASAAAPSVSSPPQQSQVAPQIAAPDISKKPQHLSLPSKPSPRPQLPPSKGLVVGTDSVAYGNVPDGTRIGDRSVVVAPTDGTNTHIAGGTAVGTKAHADPTSVAIGAGAGAGSVGGNVDMSGDGCQQKIIAGSNNKLDCGPPKYKPNDLACASFSSLAKYKGSTVAIVGIFQYEHDNGYEFQSVLGDCLSLHGIALIEPLTKTPSAHAFSNVGGFNASPNGITLSYSPDMESMANDLRESISASKAVDEKEVSMRLLRDGHLALAITIAPRGGK